MKRGWLLLGLCLGVYCPAVLADNVTISVRDTEIAQVIEMIARQQRVNVLLPAKIKGEISLNLYDVPVEQALAAVANAGGFALEKRGNSYFLINHDEVGRYANGDVTELKWYDLNYVDGAKVRESVESYLSRYGKVSHVENRNLLVVQDSPEFLRRIDALMAAIDRQPRQVMIEARILEVTLNDDENLGIDCRDVFQGQDGNGTYGTRGFIGAPDAAGFFFTLETPNVTAALNALRDEGRLRTLSTPKLVALEKQEASVVIGDRRGYQVTTTINQVTTESIEFLESGVILRVTVEIDEQGRILMSVHPEVSTGAVDANGIPSQTTTEVTTNLLVPSGETIFIGGLIKKTETEQRQSVPLLNRVPVVRRLFAGTENSQITTETVVLITPVLADDLNADWNRSEIDRVEHETIGVPNYRKWHPLTQRKDKPAAPEAGESDDADPLYAVQRPQLIALDDALQIPVAEPAPSSVSDGAINERVVSDGAVRQGRPVPDIWPIIELTPPVEVEATTVTTVAEEVSVPAVVTPKVNKPSRRRATSAAVATRDQSPGVRWLN
jgi:type II secretory pathway component GspD/PulD (secretin)